MQPIASFTNSLTTLQRGSAPAAAAAEARAKWIEQARPKQLLPAGDWETFLALAGRGWGKTLVGANGIRDWGAVTPEGRFAVISPTAGDVRRVCFEGVTGLRANIPSIMLHKGDWSKAYNKTHCELMLWNGALIQGFSADEPDRLRGPQFHGAWCDEIAAWRYPEAYDNLAFGLRLGPKPKEIITTTPRPVRLVKEMIARIGNGVFVVTGSTFENEALPQKFRDRLLAKYHGTRLGEQELYAKVLDDTPGALWTLANISKYRVRILPPLARVVVAIDPPASSPKTEAERQAAESGEAGPAECGIVVAGKGVNGHAYVLEDCSVAGTPQEWGTAALAAYDTFHCDRAIGETNQGGEMVEHVLRTIKSNVSYKGVHASRGKIARAEPVAALYEQGRVHHVGVMAALEDQMTTYVPANAKRSPDRMDALVWALTELMLDEIAIPSGAPISLTAANAWRV